MEIHHSVIGVISLIGALFVLSIFAVMDFYALHQCLIILRTATPTPDLCAPDHIFRSSLEIAGMAIGLYGVSKVMRS